MRRAKEAGPEDPVVGAEASCGMPASLRATRTFPFKDRSAACGRLAWLGSEACGFTPPTAWYSREKEGPPRIRGQQATRGILGPHARIHRNYEHTQGNHPTIHTESCGPPSRAVYTHYTPPLARAQGHTQQPLVPGACARARPWALLSVCTSRLPCAPRRGGGVAALRGRPAGGQVEEQGGERREGALAGGGGGRRGGGCGSARRRWR